MMQYIEQAANFANKRKDEREFNIGAVGIRSDGAIVQSRNLPHQVRARHVHAEHRLCKMLDVGATVFVARRTKNGELAMAKPCKNCEITLKRSGVKFVYYSVGPNKIEKMTLH